MKCNCDLREKMFYEIMDVFEKYFKEFTPVEAIDLLIHIAVYIAETCAPTKEQGHNTIEDLVQHYINTELEE